MEFEEIGSDLIRPECVLTTRSGDIYVAHYGIGVMRIARNGEQEIFAAHSCESIATNGFALHPDGSFLIADLGERGGVWRLQRNGKLSPFVTEVQGYVLPQTNFVSIDASRRVWITVSTRQAPRDRAFRSDVRDGFVICARLDGSGARIVADGLGYTNEAHVDPSGRWLYANETFAQRLSRFPISSNSLGQRETVYRFSGADFPDGLAFDEKGGVWIACIVSNQLWRIGTAGDAVVVVSNKDDAYCNQAAAAFSAGRLSQAHLQSVPKSSLGNISSICFGGEDRQNCYLGNLANKHIMRFRTHWVGVEPPHWQWA